MVQRVSLWQPFDVRGLQTIIVKACPAIGGEGWVCGQEGVLMGT